MIKRELPPDDHLIREAALTDVLAAEVKAAEHAG